MSHRMRRDVLLPLVSAVISISVGCGKQQAAVSTSANTPAASGQPTVNDLLEVDDSQARRPSNSGMLRFRDVADELKVHFQRFSDVVPERYFLPEVMGGGVAWFDYDRDGWLDLYATDGCQLWDPPPTQSEHLDRLFRNRSGVRFTDVTTASGSREPRYGQGCTAGDFNADGFTDLYISNYGRNTLFSNNGDGTFEDATIAAGVGDELWGTSAVWLDANADGHADLYAVNYVNVSRANHHVCTYGGVEGYCGPGQWSGVDDRLYLNLGDGRFEPAGKPEGVEAEHAKGLAVGVADFDGDGRPEIYVANDMMPNFLLTWLPGAGTAPGPLYRNVADAAGCALSGDGRNEASMGVALADFDGDGQVDIFLSHYYQQKNTLYRNLGSMLFEDDSYRSRIAATSFHTLGFGTVTCDFDHDGDADLFIANGHVLGPKHMPNEMTPQLLVNGGGGVFDDVSERIGDYFARRCLGRGAAGGDYDNDGRLDLSVSHLDHPLAVLHNETRGPHHFIGLELRPVDRVFPAGGRLIVTGTGHQWNIPIVWGGSYLSSNDPRIVVGLGDYHGRVDVQVVWPGRGTDMYRDLSAGTYWMLQEGGAGIASSATGAQRTP